MISGMRRDVEAKIQPRKGLLICYIRVVDAVLPKPHMSKFSFSGIGEKTQ